jgi:hypothetical protein
MRKLAYYCFVLFMVMAFGFGTASAEPSAKATAQFGNLAVVEVDSDGPQMADWQEIFRQYIKMPSGKDLFIDVSMECGITTDTTVMSKLLEKSLAFSEALVKVRVKLNGVPVAVNKAGDSEITFAIRSQTLIAEFAGYIPEECYVVDPITHAVTIDPECVQEETLQLILDTMTANSFNFIAPDLASGEYWVSVEAMLVYDIDPTSPGIDYDNSGEAYAKAYLGNGSVTVEAVRMVKGEDAMIELQ